MMIFIASKRDEMFVFLSSSIRNVFVSVLEIVSVAIGSTILVVVLFCMESECQRRIGKKERNGLVWLRISSSWINTNRKSMQDVGA